MAQQKLSQPSPRHVTLLRFHYHKELEALKPPGCVKGDEYRPALQGPSFIPALPLLPNYLYGEQGARWVLLEWAVEIPKRASPGVEMCRKSS